MKTYDVGLGSKKLNKRFTLSVDGDFWLTLCDLRDTQIGLDSEKA